MFYISWRRYLTKLGLMMTTQVAYIPDEPRVPSRAPVTLLDKMSANVWHQLMAAKHVSHRDERISQAPVATATIPNYIWSCRLMGGLTG